MDKEKHALQTKSNSFGLACVPMCNRSLKPRVTSSAVRSPSLSRSALVATVVPIRIQPIREVSTGWSRGKIRPVSWGGTLNSLNAFIPDSIRYHSNDLFQDSADALSGGVFVILGVPGQQFQHSLAAVGEPGKHVGESAATVDGKVEFPFGLSHSEERQKNC